MLPPVTPDDFENFFREAHDAPPYPWQRRLAERAVAGDWPETLSLPTGSGKTAMIDIAVFALACQATLPPQERSAARRIFWCVNRRVIVQAAYQRALRLARRLLAAERDPRRYPTLARVAAALRAISTLRPESAPPLDVLELRGGLYRDNRWARSATHPLVACATIDQFGSRLLFRGYGVSASAAPIQAGLAAYDSLAFLDEAHISRPFLQTLEAVRDYLDPTRWAEQAIGARPMQVVALTATPLTALSADLALDAEDRATPRLQAVLSASKPARLQLADDLPKALVAEAKRLAQEGPRAVGVMVNRVATARAVHAALCKAFPEATVELVIGAMRPFDRDAQQARLATLVGPDRPEVSQTRSFVVATQCLEVGADYDFDALVTECASLDALRQRFGRLNRRGRSIPAQAVIVMDEKAVSPSKPDPIYGAALPNAWAWLQRVAASNGTVDFGIDAFDALLASQGGSLPADCLAPAAQRDAAALLPAHLDLLCQTSPRPSLDPDVALLLHGAQPGEPDAQVCWRADLDAFPPEDWSEVVGLLPPTAAECLTVPLSRLRQWLTGEAQSKDASSDLLGGGADSPGTKPAQDKASVLVERRPLLWRGLEDQQLLTTVDDLRPGDTLVLPVSAGGWDALGYLPPSAPRDVAEAAAVQARDRAVARLHPSLTGHWPALPALTDLFARLADPETTLNLSEWRAALLDIADALDAGLQPPPAAPSSPAEPPALPQPSSLTADCLRRLADPQLGLIRAFYPDGRGCVLVTRRRLGAATDWATALADEGEDEASFLASGQPVTLEAHSRHVRDEIQRVARALPLNIREAVLLAAAEGHDWGKADERFQAVLRRADRMETWLLSVTPTALLAKSDALPLTKLERRQARERAGLPGGWRHEMLSVQMLAAARDDRGADLEASGFTAEERDLILYLVGTHHGRGRPFAPVAADVAPPNVTLTAELAGRRYTATLDARQRADLPPHRLDAGIGARFWRMQRRYGWWGAAYLEAALRLSDHQASLDEEEGRLT